jgi:hypothetical protein
MDLLSCQRDPEKGECNQTDRGGNDNTRDAALLPSIVHYTSGDVSALLVYKAEEAKYDYRKVARFERGEKSLRSRGGGTTV